MVSRTLKEVEGFDFEEWGWRGKEWRTVGGKTKDRDTQIDEIHRYI